VRKIVPALLIAAIAASGISAPAAYADAGGPTVQWAGSIETDLGRIRVLASSDVGVTSLVAHIIAPSTGTEVGVVTAFHLASGTAESGYWESDEILLPNLGYYSLNVEATDVDGGHSEADGIGTLAYAVKMSYADLKTSTTVTYVRRNYEISGKLIGTWPGTGAVAPVANMPLYALVPDGYFTDTVNTDAKGEFSLSAPVEYTDGGPGYISTMDDPARPYFLQGYSDLQAATIKPAPTRVTINIDTDSIISGDPVTVSGDAMWKSPNGWLPMANAPIAIGQCPPGQDTPGQCFSGPTTTTDANGHYSVVVNPYSADMLMAGAVSDDIFIQQVSTASAKITVLMPTWFDGPFAYRDSSNGQVDVASGGLRETGYSEADTVVSVEFSKDGVTGWHTVSTIDLGSNPGSSFDREYDHPGPGYWRLTYAGVKGLLEPAQTDAMYVA
jgi:hypothetical protein